MTYWRELKNPQLEMLVDAWHPVHIADGKAYAPWWATYELFDVLLVMFVLLCLASIFSCIASGDFRALVGAAFNFALAWYCEEAEEGDYCNGR